MAEQEKDYTMPVVIGVAVLAIVGVLMLKNTEVRHLQMSAETTAAQEAQVLAKHKNLNNDVLNQAK